LGIYGVMHNLIACTKCHIWHCGTCGCPRDIKTNG
jgi:hypothetical protein